MVALKCDRCGRRIPYIVEAVKLADGRTVNVRNYHPTLKPGYALICFRCAGKADKREVNGG